MKQANPFLIYGYVSPEYFCDRKKETNRILSALENERNLTLIAPRRMGKTGLIRNTFYRMAQTHPDVRCFYMDIYPTRNLNDFVSLLGQTVLGQVDSFSQNLLRQISTFFKSCRPVINVNETNGMPSISLEIVPNQEHQTLKEIFDYLVASERKCYVAIDEFQQITEYPEEGIEALLRSYTQFTPNVHFIFAGSKQHIMTEMFASAKRPFYQSTQMMALAEIDESLYYDFANDFFRKENRTLACEGFRYIYQKFGGHTWYIQSILNRMYSYKDSAIALNEVHTAIREILCESEFMFQNYLALLTDNQAKLLKAIAKEEPVSAINSGEFIGKHKLKAVSSVNTALKTLINKELIYKSDMGYIVYDRFFGQWLREQPF